MIIIIFQGYIIQKREDRPNQDGGPDFFLTNQEFHPLLYLQNKDQVYVEYETFDRAVDEFYSALEGQKIDLKVNKIKVPFILENQTIFCLKLMLYFC